MKFKVCLFVLFISIFTCFESKGQNNVGIGTTAPNTNALLDLSVPDPSSTPLGLLLPRLSTGERTSMSLGAPENGMIVFDTDLDSLVLWNGAAWQVLEAGAGGSGDNLGNHTATTNLDMNDNELQYPSAIVIADPQTGNDHFIYGNDPGYPGDGITLRPTGNPGNGDPIFRILSSGGVERLRVEHGGVLYTDNDLQVSGLAGGATEMVVADASGLLSKQPIPSGGNDNLGNHRATQNVELNGNWISNNGNNEGIQIDNDGDVFVSERMGIGVANPTHALDVDKAFCNSHTVGITNGSTCGNASGMRIGLGSNNPGSGNKFIFFQGAGTNIGEIRGQFGGVAYSTTSDRRLKTNFRNYEAALQTVSQIGVYHYTYKATPETPQVGFIAQELAEHFPYVVSQDPENPDDPLENPMMVEYGAVTPLNTQAIKELHQLVIALEAENKEVKQQNEALVNQLKAIEQRLEELEE